MTFARESLPFVLPFALLALLAALAGWRLWAVVAAIAGLLVLLFFRDPPKPDAAQTLAALAAQADIKAGHYDLACVVGVELMRNATAQEAADNLAAAAWIGREGQEAQWMWPWMFSKLRAGRL